MKPGDKSFIQPGARCLRLECAWKSLSSGTSGIDKERVAIVTSVDSKSGIVSLHADGPNETWYLVHLEAFFLFFSFL